MKYYGLHPGTVTESINLVSVGEIADRLGVTPATVHTWRNRGILPAPDFPLAVGPVWWWVTIYEWAQETGRLTPPSTTQTPNQNHQTPTRAPQANPD